MTTALTDDPRGFDRQNEIGKRNAVCPATITRVARQSWADNCAQIAFYDLSRRSVAIIGRSGDGDGGGGCREGRCNKTKVLMPVDKSRIVIDSGWVYSTRRQCLRKAVGRKTRVRDGTFGRTQEVCIDARTRKHKDVVSELFCER